MTDQSIVLLVEDDATQRQLVSSILTKQGYVVHEADSVEAAIVLLKKTTVDVVFSDWKLGTLTGLDLLNYVRRNQPDLGFAIATAYGTIAHAVDAINAGADDYLAKPFQRQELLLCLDKIIKARQLKRNNRQLQAALSEQQSLVELVGNAPRMQQVYQRIQKISNTDVTVLITGESGTGKELAARALHQLSERNNQPFIAVNCGAIPENLAEAELFGAIKGAYTGATQDKPGKFQSAQGGTIFLDEIGELPLALQTKLLRVLQEATVTPLGSSQEIAVDVRVIAATHRDLRQMVTEGDFREDLLYRLNVVPIHMPALRERREDIAKLIDFFLSKFAVQYQLAKPELSKELLKVLMDHPWPGNVRELSNRLERYCLLEDGAELMAELKATTASARSHLSGFVLPDAGIDWDALERDCLQQALQRCQGNRTAAAKLLGLGYKAFLYRLEKHGLSNN